jgi:oxygen-independent coproporphyrinogen-3 oxidase
MNSSVYIHIPFCRQKCCYCDFVSYAGAQDWQQPYIAALCREIAGRGGVFAKSGITINSIFVGGGTPTCLSADLLAELFSCIKQSLPLTAGAECSVEANPGTVDESKLTILREAGVNRLSFGVQAFDDRLLHAIGRIHRSVEAVQAIHLARQAGFSNLNLDLMHGLPGQSLAAYQDSLAIAVELGVEHISAYSLIVEADTPLAGQLECGELSLPEEEIDAAMFELSHDYLAAHGYEHYEISNYARPGKRCQHNLAYWQYRPYVGFGVAACSFDGRVRVTNTANVQQYIEQIRSGKSPVADSEELSWETMLAEYTFLALRTTDGVAESDFTARFSIDFRAYYRNVLTNLMEAGLIADTAAGIRLTRQGLRFGNRVFASFLP